MAEWMIQWEWESDNANASVGEKLAGGTFYEVARIENVPVEEDEDGEVCLVKEGKEADRLREVGMVVHAPEMLQTLRHAAAALQIVTGLHGPDGECGKWVQGKGTPTEEAWSRLIRIQDAIERQIDRVEDLDYL